MYLCVKSDNLVHSEKLQKKVMLSDILSSVAYFDTEEEALESNYTPVTVGISVRSMYDNSAITDKEGNFIFVLEEVFPFIHKGYDLLMYLSSLILMGVTEYSYEYQEIMMKHSQFMPMGVFYPLSQSREVPLIYAHIILSDEGMELLKNHLKKDHKVVDIKDLSRSTLYGNLKEELIVVEKGDNNE